MKKIVAIILTLLLVLSLVSCNSEEQDDSTSSASSVQSEVETLKWSGFTIGKDDSEFTKGVKTSFNKLIEAKSFDFEMTLTQEPYLDDMLQGGVLLEEDSIEKLSSGTAEYDFENMTFKLFTNSTEGDAVVFLENGKGYSAVRDNSDTDWEIDFTENSDSDSTELSIKDYMDGLSKFSSKDLLPLFAQTFGIDLEEANSEKLDTAMQKISDTLADEEKGKEYISTEIWEQDDSTVYVVTLDGEALMKLMKEEFQGVFEDEEALAEFNSSFEMYDIMFAGFELSAEIVVKKDGLPSSVGILLNVPSMMSMDMQLNIKNIGNAEFVLDESLSDILN